MRKSKPSKRSPTPKKAARAQRAAQAFVKSPSDRRKRSFAAGSIASAAKDDPTPGPLLTEGVAKGSEDDRKASMTVIELMDVTDAYSVPLNVRGYQAMLLEMAQANMQFSFEFAQRLATIRSPIEFLNIIAESTNKRIAMFEKHSKEIAAFLALR